jgi:hypothetical protein
VKHSVTLHTIPRESTHGIDVYAFEFRRDLCLFLDNCEVYHLKSEDFVVLASEVRMSWETIGTLFAAIAKQMHRCHTTATGSVF